MKIEVKKTPEDKDKFSDKLDLMKYTAEIKLRLKKDITADFVLARLSEQDKKGIIEMASNSYLAKRLMTRTMNEEMEPHWDNKEKKWYWTELSDKDKNRINDLSNLTFDAYMTRIYMTVVLNRNIDGNYLINVLTNYKEEEEVNIPTEEEKSLKEKVTNLLSNKEKKEEK